jgi:hypothetical protein
MTHCADEKRDCGYYVPKRIQKFNNQTLATRNCLKRNLETSQEDLRFNEESKTGI